MWRALLGCADILKTASIPLQYSALKEVEERFLYSNILFSDVSSCHSPLSPTLPAPVLLVPDPPSGRGTRPRPSGTAGAPQGSCMLIALWETEWEKTNERCLYVTVYYNIIVATYNILCIIKHSHYDIGKLYMVQAHIYTNSITTCTVCNFISTMMWRHSTRITCKVGITGVAFLDVVQVYFKYINFDN